MIWNVVEKKTASRVIKSIVGENIVNYINEALWAVILVGRVIKGNTFWSKTVLKIPVAWWCDLVVAPKSPLHFI